MTIREMVVKPNLDRLKEDFGRLEIEISSDSSGEAAILRSYVLQKMRELNSINSSFEDMNDVYRQFKMTYRRVYRQWRKLLSNESRYRKTLERRIHVSSVAA